MLSTLFFYQINATRAGKMTTPPPSTDGVRVAVRVRPFSQVSDGCDAAWLKL